MRPLKLLEAFCKLQRNLQKTVSEPLHYTLLPHRGVLNPLSTMSQLDPFVVHVLKSSLPKRSAH